MNPHCVLIEAFHSLQVVDPQCDFTKDIAVYYPLHVIMSIMGVPESDELLMLKLTQELFGGGDIGIGRRVFVGD